MALAACSIAGRAAQAEPLTIEQAVDPTGTLAVSLSPDGKHLASIIYNGTNHGLLLHDTADMSAKLLSFGRRVQEGFWNFHKAPRNVTWVGNDLLAVDYGVEAETINLHGKKVAEVGQSVIGPAEGGNLSSTKLLVYTDVDDGDMALTDGRSGESRQFKYPKGKLIQAAFDPKGELRAVTVVNSEFWRDASTVTNWYKPSAGTAWQKLADFKVTDEYWLPVYVPDEPDTIVVSSRLGRDTYALFNFNTRRLAFGDMLAGHPTQDILSVGGIDQGAFERVTTRGMRPQDIWFDPGWSGVQRAVDVALPNRGNRLSGDPKGKVLVSSSSDQDAGSWYLLDMQSKALRLVARRQPASADADLRPMEIIAYAAGDGTQVPAFLTRPAAKPDAAAGAGPLVVLIHGGPTARDYWGWNAEVQLLAARGYAVFQPQFRGSSGFGRRFEQAGFGQWGLAMQDDITAGVRYLVDQKIADPKRICIVGASYGGYAALWGLVKTPELYRCGVSFAGVADIGFMFNDSSDRVGNKVTRQHMLARIGDVRSNKEQFDQVSPLKHADRIVAPVLLMHGEDDERVPIAHSKKMRKALELHGKKVEWLAFEEEGHGLRFIRNEKAYYEKLLAFLDKYIGAPAAARP